MTPQEIDPSGAWTLVTCGAEVAFLDIRPAGPFSMGHPLFAVPCAYDTLEIEVGRLVPRLSVPVVVLGAGDGTEHRAARALARMGYEDIRVIAGGVRAWRAAGLPLYQGVNVPSKVLGELVAEINAPPVAEAATLAGWKREGRAVRVLDCRPPAEFEKMTVPGAACLPNGELAHRLPALEPLDGTLVLTCAGRTRGLLGAAGIALAAPGTEVLALEDGTQGWVLSGETLERGAHCPPFPELDDDQREVTRKRARELMRREGIPETGSEEIATMGGEGTRTTYRFDVRSAAEARADPLPAFRHVWSGQLVQATDRYVGVRHARIVLADDEGLRAALAAYWLRIMGYDVRVARVSDGLRALEAAPEPCPRQARPPSISAAEALRRASRQGTRLLDLRPSETFRKGHVAGAAWARRSDLAAGARVTDKALMLVDGGDGAADLAAADLLRRGAGGVRVVEGGHPALVRAGAAVTTTADLPPPEECPDVTWFAHGRHDGDLDASRTYLAWEHDLTARLAPEERRAFAI